MLDFLRKVVAVLREAVKVVDAMAALAAAVMRLRVVLA
jgi:hypothetical protein